MGPVGSGKSSLVERLQRGLESSAAIYAIEGCPMNEEPLHLIPRHLRREFEIAEYGAGDRRGASHVSLVPKRKQIRESLARLDLWVNQPSLLLESLQITFANGDVKEMAFEDVVPNASIDPGAFIVD